MNFFDELRRITRAHCEVMGYPVPKFMVEAAAGGQASARALTDNALASGRTGSQSSATPMVPHRCRVEGDMEIEAGKPCNWCGAIEPDFAIPASIRKPTSGACVYCAHDTEDMDGGEWLHDECRDVLVDEQQADYRADDPRHGQAGDLNRRR